MEDLHKKMQEYGDAMLERMQRPGAREAMQKAFEATPEELGEVAVRAAQLDKIWFCDGCKYGSHCLGADPDCDCCD